MSDNTQGDKPASEGGHAIIRSIQTKMHNLVQEFGAGKVSNEQFNILYERFNSQLSVAMSLSDAEASQSSDVSTMLIREATTGRAVGLGVYHHPSSTIIETLGNFDIPPAVLTPTLNGLSARIDNNEYLEPKVQKAQIGFWIVFVTRRYTTSILLFRNEPAPVQIREIERLHHDFEQANRRYLEQHTVDASKLAHPFIGFVKQKLNK